MIALNSAVLFRQPDIFMAIDGNKLTDVKHKAGFPHLYFMKTLQNPAIIKMLELFDAFQYRICELKRGEGSSVKGYGYDSFGRYLKERIPDFDKYNVRFFIGEKNRPFGDTPYLLKGGSVAYTAIHYAYQEGYNPIILSGVDLCYLPMNKNDKSCYKYFWQKDNSFEIENDLNLWIQQSPCGEEVFITHNFKVMTNALIKLIAQVNQESVGIYKTSKRGMLDIPVIKNHHEALHKKLETAGYIYSPIKEFERIPESDLHKCYKYAISLLAGYKNKDILYGKEKGYIK